MTTITEDYCSYEVAKLLKEKGFNEKCRGGYHSEFDDNDRPIVMLEEWMAQLYNNDFVDEGFLCSAPTHQMAMKWLREVHNIAIDTEWEHLWYAYVKPMTSNPTEDDYCQCFSAKYEEAVEAALKYSLNNLI